MREAFLPHLCVCGDEVVVSARFARDPACFFHSFCGRVRGGKGGSAWGRRRARLAFSVALLPALLPTSQFLAALAVCSTLLPWQNGKPAPDCFAAVAARLGLQPSQCLVIEDAPAGVAAAAAAGMRVVAVPSMLQKGGRPR